MKKSTKAALLSGLIFPGIGHMVLKSYRRGFVLVLFALAATSVIINVATQRALAVVDRINSGDIYVESEAIAEMISNSTNGADSLMVNISTIILGVCWLVGIIDSYRLGVEQEG